MAGLTIVKDAPKTGLSYGLAETTAEAALWAQISSLAPLRQGFLWKAGAARENGNTKYTRGGLRNDAPTGFLARDIFGRKFIPRIPDTTNRTQDRHPILAKQVRTSNDLTVLLDRPSLMFGNGPTGWLTSAQSGDLRPDPSTDEDVFVTGGYVAIWEILIPAPSTTVHVDYGDGSTVSVTGLATSKTVTVMGARSDRNSTGKAFDILYDTSGILTIANQTGATIWNSVRNSHDHRDTVRHLQMAVFDQAGGVLNCYEYAGGVETQLGTHTGISTSDVLSTAGDNRKCRIAACGQDSYNGGAGVTANGGSFMTCCGWLPLPSLGTTAPNRLLLWNWALEA